MYQSAVDKYLRHCHKSRLGVFVGKTPVQ